MIITLGRWLGDSITVVSNMRKILLSIYSSLGFTNHAIKQYIPDPRVSNALSEPLHLKVTLFATLHYSC